MGRNAKQQTAKKMRGRAVKHDPLWQLQDADFERNHWWMETPSSGSKPVNLREKHPQLAPLRDEKGHKIVRVAPIVWELLRRRPEIVTVRKELAAVLAPGPLHRVILSDEAEIAIEQLGFGIEVLLAVCGLNAWESQREYSLDDWSTKAGTRLISGPSRMKFEQSMPACCSGRPAPICVPSREAEVDLVELARQHARIIKEMGFSHGGELDPANPLSAVTQDASELKMLGIHIISHAKRGYHISIIARHPSPVFHPGAGLSHSERPDDAPGPFARIPEVEFSETQF
jgi:hypothetical protein